MKIALEGPPAEVEAIRELLSPWKITFTGLDESEIAIVYNQKPTESNKTIVIPSDSASFTTWSKKNQLKVTRKIDRQAVSVKTTQTTLAFRPRVLYQQGNSPQSASPEVTCAGTEVEGNHVILGVDAVKEYKECLYETLNVEQAKLYKLFTGLPIPYGLAPKRVRDYFMKDRNCKGTLTLLDKLPVDALRIMLVQAINKLSGKELQKKTWNGQKFACLMTHDIENYEGLETALHVKKLEEKYDVPSAWYIPSKRYKLKDEIVKTLTNYGEVGAHDTKHDGKLATLSKDQLVERLTDAKQTLTNVAEAFIAGFRAPLLQHNFQILEALDASGYVYDASIPSWEPKHPCTMKPQGIGTVFPFHVNNFAEVPLTLPQDHQMLHALGMTPQQTVDAWTNLMEEIKMMGGSCVILTHPNELANMENQRTYEDLLNRITSVKDASITLPRTMAESFLSNN